MRLRRTTARAGCVREPWARHCRSRPSLRHRGDHRAVLIQKGLCKQARYILSAADHGAAFTSHLGLALARAPIPAIRAVREGRGRLSLRSAGAEFSAMPPATDYPTAMPCQRHGLLVRAGKEHPIAIQTSGRPREILRSRPRRPINPVYTPQGSCAILNSRRPDNETRSAPVESSDWRRGAWRRFIWRPARSPLPAAMSTVRTGESLRERVAGRRVVLLDRSPKE